MRHEPQKQHRVILKPMQRGIGENQRAGLGRGPSRDIGLLPDDALVAEIALGRR
jgi:hypothetical protein